MERSGRFAEAIGPVYAATPFLQRGYGMISFSERSFPYSETRTVEWRLRSRTRYIKEGGEGNLRHERKKIVILAQGHHIETCDRNDARIIQ